MEGKATSNRVPVRGIASELEQHRGYLMRIARLQLRDESLAEDAVQEAMLAALASQNFSGASTLRTWLTSILKHKIIDAIRRRQRQAEVSVVDAEAESSGDDYESPFDENGGWQAKPASWSDPEQSLNQRQFFDIMALCMEHLPSNTARVFVMREYLDFEVSEISRELKITAANIYVILYRARAGLRECLEKNWFGDARRSTPASSAP